MAVPCLSQRLDSLAGRADDLVLCGLERVAVRYPGAHGMPEDGPRRLEAEAAPDVRG